MTTPARRAGKSEHVPEKWTPVFRQGHAQINLKSKSLSQKLGIQPGFRIFVAGAPGPYETVVGKLPDAAILVGRLGKTLDMIHVFATERTTLAKELAGYRSAIEPDGMVWVSWPKKASGVPTNLTDRVVRDVALPLGLVDVKVCSVDATWSGLKFVIRRELRQR